MALLVVVYIATAASRLEIAVYNSGWLVGVLSFQLAFKTFIGRIGVVTNMYITFYSSSITLYLQRKVPSS